LQPGRFLEQTMTAFGFLGKKVNDESRYFIYLLDLFWGLPQEAFREDRVNTNKKFLQGGPGGTVFSKRVHPGRRGHFFLIGNMV
jgi:hypothetical protein